MINQLITIEYRVLEIIHELNSSEVTSIDTKLTEHAVTKVILVVIKLFLLATRFRVLLQMGYNLDRIIRASFLTHGTRRAFIVLIFITQEDKTATMTLCNMQGSLAVFRILLRSLRREVFLHRHLQTCSKCLQCSTYFTEI